MQNPAPDLSQDDFDKLAEDAKQILSENWTGSFTKPSHEQYPHQWSWDSVFIAMGYSHYNQQRAEDELRHLFNGQWDNHMVPQIIFSPERYEERYFPGPDFWKTENSPHAPRSVETSGLCQPPIHASGLYHVILHAKDRSRARKFASDMFPKVAAWHRYLLDERDPDDEGLIYIRHPWESGQDNSPIWDSVLERMEVNPDELPEYSRKDDIYVDSDERPSSEEYDKYVYLVDFFRSRNYDEAKIRKDGCPFLIQDVLFNTLFCKANRDLAKVAELIGEDPTPFEQSAEKTARAMNDKLWCDQEQMYVDFDLNRSETIQSRVLSGFLPLFAGIPDENQREQIFNYLNTHCFCQLTDTCFPAPSYDRSGDGYSSRTYWRGPVWINMNWILAEGLKQYGFDDYVKQLHDSIIQLPHLSGFREYFDTDNGEGHGTDRFSWTASLLLDTLYRTGKIAT